MHLLVVVLVLVSVVIFPYIANADNFPSDVPRCKFSDGGCLNRVITGILRSHAKKGHRGLNIIPFDPLRVKSLILENSNNRPVNLEFRFKDIDLTGISQGTVRKVSGFTKEASNLVFEIKVDFPKITLSGPYSIKGRVLILPVTGEGQSKIELENVTAIAKAKCTPVEKNGEKYITIRDGKLDIKPKRVTFQLENLFNGDKALGESTNKVLNENWESVFSELKPLIDETIANIAIHLANGVFSKIPYNDLFLPS